MPFAANTFGNAFLAGQDATSRGNNGFFHHLGLHCLLQQAGAGVTGFPDVGPGCMMTLFLFGTKELFDF